MGDITLTLGQPERDVAHMAQRIVDALAHAVAEALGLDAAPATALSLAALGGAHKADRLLFQLPQPATPAQGGGPRLETNDAGWMRKTILYTGTWPTGPSGTDGKSEFTVTLEDLQNVKMAFDEGAYERVPVPWGHGAPGEDDMDHATRFNTGWVRGLEIVSDEARPGEWRLDSWLEFTDGEAHAKIIDGSVWNVSVMLAWDVTRPSDGRTFPLVLKHVALTNFPWVEGMAGFSRDADRVPAGGLPADKVEVQNEEDNMATGDQVSSVTLADVQVELARVKAQADALAAREAKLQEAEQTLAARAQQVALAQRGVHVREIVAALEGGPAASGVTVPAGYRHFPAVVQAVEGILRALPATGAKVALSKDGAEVPTEVEGVLMALLNAMPEAALQKIQAQPVLARSGAEDATPGPRKVESDEDVDAYMKDMGI